MKTTIQEDRMDNDKLVELLGAPVADASVEFVDHIGLQKFDFRVVFDMADTVPGMGVVTDTRRAVYYNVSDRSIIVEVDPDCDNDADTRSCPMCGSSVLVRCSDCESHVMWRCSDCDAHVLWSEVIVTPGSIIAMGPMPKSEAESISEFHSAWSMSQVWLSVSAD